MACLTKASMSARMRRLREDDRALRPGGVPVITVDNEVIVGFDAQRLNELFGETGATDTMRS